jgi:predicted MPP superfamily phosphohydrolase
MTTVTTYRLTPAGWPAMGLRIAVLADIHACEPFMNAERIRGIVDATNSLAPDLILLLGDYVGHLRFMTDALPLSKMSAALAGLRAPLGVHAILGNHDWWDDAEVMRRGAGTPRVRLALEDAGIPVYENDALRLSKDGHAFWLAGLGDQWAFPKSSRISEGGHASDYVGVDDMAAILAAVTDTAPIVLMVHEPDIFAEMSDRVALTLAGHMHGGQVRIAGYSPILPSRYGDRYVYGHIVERDRPMIVSGGLGCSFLPVRLGVPPEIVMVELEPSA